MIRTSNVSKRILILRSVSILKRSVIINVTNSQISGKDLYSSKPHINKGSMTWAQWNTYWRNPSLIHEPVRCFHLIYMKHYRNLWRCCISEPITGKHAAGHSSQSSKTSDQTIGYQQQCHGFCATVLFWNSYSLSWVKKESYFGPPNCHLSPWARLLTLSCSVV